MANQGENWFDEFINDSTIPSFELELEKTAPSLEVQIKRNGYPLSIEFLLRANIDELYEKSLLARKLEKANGYK